MGCRLLIAALVAGLTGAAPLQAEEVPAADTRPMRSIVVPPAEIGTGVENAKPLNDQALRINLQQAHAKSKTAQTIAEYGEVLELCLPAADHAADGVVKQYAQQLAAWAANRRGEAYSQEAARLTSEGKFDEAAAYDQKALADFEVAVERDPAKWKSLHNRGVSYALLGRYEEALADLTKALELNANYVNTWYNRAEVRYELGQYEDAASDYTEVLRRTPDDFGALTGRGHAWFRMGELQKALADYHRAVSLDPQSAGALVNRGDTYRQLGQWQQAAADYRAAVKVDEAYGRGYRSAAWLMATCPDEKYRNADLAVRAAEKAIELDGAQDYLYLDVLAAALASAGKYSEAVQAAEQALEIAPEEATMALGERLTLYRDGKPYRLPTFTTARPTPARR